MVIAGDGLSTVKADKIMRWNDAEKGMRSSKYYIQNKQYHITSYLFPWIKLTVYKLLLINYNLFVDSHPLSFASCRALRVVSPLISISLTTTLADLTWLKAFSTSPGVNRSLEPFTETNEFCPEKKKYTEMKN